MKISNSKPKTYELLKSKFDDDEETFEVWLTRFPFSPVDERAKNFYGKEKERQKDREKEREKEKAKDINIDDNDEVEEDEKERFGCSVCKKDVDDSKLVICEGKNLK